MEYFTLFFQTNSLKFKMELTLTAPLSVDQPQSKCSKATCTAAQYCFIQQYSPERGMH